MTEILYLHRDNCRPFKEHAVGDNENISVTINGKTNEIIFDNDDLDYDDIEVIDISEIGVALRNKKLTEIVYAKTGLIVYYIVQYTDMAGTRIFEVCRYDGDKYTEHVFVGVIGGFTVIEGASGQTHSFEGKLDFTVLESIV